MNDEPATNQPEESEVQALAHEMRAGFGAIDGRFDQIEKRIGEMADWRETNLRFEGIEKRITDEGETMRRYVDTRISEVATRIAKSLPASAKSITASAVSIGASVKANWPLANTWTCASRRKATPPAGTST